jgi:hypothetical protein
VLVLAVALAALVVGFQDCLDRLEQLLVYECFVASGVNLALVADLARVEGVREQGVDG